MLRAAQQVSGGPRSKARSVRAHPGLDSIWAPGGQLPLLFVPALGPLTLALAPKFQHTGPVGVSVSQVPCRDCCDLSGLSLRSSCIRGEQQKCLWLSCPEQGWWVDWDALWERGLLTVTFWTNG